MGAFFVVLIFIHFTHILLIYNSTHHFLWKSLSKRRSKSCSKSQIFYMQMSVCSRLKSTMRQQQKKASLAVFVNSRIFYLELIRKILNILLHTLQFTLCGSKKDISNVLMRKRREINLLSENYDYAKAFVCHVTFNRETWLGCSLAVLKEII